MDGWEIVFRAQGMAEAAVVSGYLEDNGVPVDLDYESAGTVVGITMDGLGEVRIRVPSEYADLAQTLIAERTGGPETEDAPSAGSDDGPDAA
jgi:hypothetical protein